MLNVEQKAREIAAGKSKKELEKEIDSYLDKIAMADSMGHDAQEMKDLASELAKLSLRRKGVELAEI